MTLAPTMLSQATIARLAGEVAEQTSYRFGDEIAPAVKALGGEIHSRNFWETDQKHAHSLLVRGHGDFTIWQPSTCMRPRQRFEIAHNIGHYVLHFLWKRHTDGDAAVPAPMFVSHYIENERADYEANWFGINFIAPKDAFTRLFHETGGDFYAIEKACGLSYYFINLRAKALGLLPNEARAA